MQWDDAIEDYLRDQRQAGRINSENTERAYRSTLFLHAQDAEREPLDADREDCKRTLARWGNPNTRARGHSVLVSFYDWLLTEGYRRENPARQVRKAKLRQPSVYRLTRSEVEALIAVCETPRERRVILLGVGTGARCGELAGFQGRHFQREGFIWFSADIAKGQRERWVPVLHDLQGMVGEIRRGVPAHHHVIASERGATKPIDRTTIGRIVKEIAKRAGISANVYPHLLRHAYGDHVARHAGLRVAQALMGHASVQTTASIYVDRPHLEELSEGVRELRLAEPAAARRERFEAQMHSTSKDFARPLDTGATRR